MNEQVTTASFGKTAEPPTWYGSLLTRPMMRLFRFVLVLYIFMLVFLPSGEMFGINFKVLCFIALLPLALQVTFTSRPASKRDLTMLFLVPVIFIFWMLLSQIYGFLPADAMAQYKDLIVTIATCWFAVVICDEGAEATRFLLRTIVLTEFITSAIKLLILVYAFARHIPLTQIIATITAIFGVQLMPFNFESLLGRLEFISDNLIPVCIFALLCYKDKFRVRSRNAFVMLIVFLISDFFAFSRYLWVFTVFALLAGLIVGKKDRFQLLLTSAIGVLTLVSLPVLIEVVSLRFSTTVVSNSDTDRTAQIVALKKFFVDAPWFGHGLGSYTSQVIRSTQAPYSYEAQLLALAGQVGMIGIILLTLLTLYYFRKLWGGTSASRLRRIGLGLLLLAWIAGGFVNPSVISSAASVSYAALYAMSLLNDDGITPVRP